MIRRLKEAALGAWARLFGKKETAEDLHQKLTELVELCWELRPDLESDDARTVRAAAERARLLIARCAKDARLMMSCDLALAMLSQLSDQKKQAVERMREDPEWKLLDAVEGKKE